MVQRDAKYNLACLGVLLILVCDWGCAHELQDKKSNILETLNSSQDTVVVRYGPKPMRFDDPGCKGGYSPNLGLPLFPFLHSNPCLRSASALGEKLTQEFTFQDPTALVQERFLSEIGSKVMGNLRVLPRILEVEDPADIGTSLVLDFKTFESSFKVWATHYEANNAPFHFWFGVRSSLTQVQERRTLWVGACFYRTNERGEGPYNFDVLLSDGGAKIKQIINHAADECGKQLAIELLKER